MTWSGVIRAAICHFRPLWIQCRGVMYPLSAVSVGKLLNAEQALLVVTTAGVRSWLVMNEPRPAAAIRAAVEQFGEIAGRQPDGVTGVRPAEGGGWSILLDVVELERIPASTSVLATYRVDVDGNGVLQSYERLRRYTRGATDR